MQRCTKTWKRAIEFQRPPPHPANNVHRRNEAVASDTIFAPVPAIDDGSAMAQLFIGRSSLASDTCGMKKKAAFVNAFEANMRYQSCVGALVFRPGFAT